MPLKAHITDPGTGLKASVVDGSGEKSALVVATRPYKTLNNRFIFFADPNGSINMNIAVGFGDPLPVYDGGDRTTWDGVADWVFSVPAGNPANFDATSTDHAKNAAIVVTNNGAIIGGDTITIVTTAATTILTEGVEWNLGGNAAATIDSIAAAIDAIATLTSSDDGIDTANFYISNGYDITSIAFSGGGLSGSAQSVDFTGGLSGNIMQFTSAAGDIDLTLYSALTGYIYITKWHLSGMTIQGHNNGVGPLGNSVNIADYVTSSTDEWQKFSIPLVDLGISGLPTTFDSLRFSSQNNNFEGYLDYIELQATGGVDITSYSIRPKKNTWLYVKEIQFALADELDSTLANASMPSLSYDTMLGLPALSTGIVYQRIQNGIVRETLVVKTVGDWLQFATARINTLVCDGTNTFLTIGSKFMEPIILKSEDGDELRVIISDNLSGLDLVRISCGCGEEDRTIDHNI